MKNLFLFPLLLVSFLSCCQTDGTKTYKNVSYGSDPQQLIDVYLPENSATQSKVFLLLHGGGWHKGTKDNMDYMAKRLRKEFPDYAVVNINYRLSSPEQPAYPMQIEDIKQVISFLKSKAGDYNITNKYAFIGSSAGAHLALLYSYGFDKEHEVQVVCSMIGPVDFTDPSYTSNPLYSSGMLKYLVGKENTYEKNPELFKEVSPVSHVTKDAPKTIMFHGANDPLVPKTQGPLLKKALDKYGIENELYIYEGEGHGKWNDEHAKDIRKKMFAFLHKNF